MIKLAAESEDQGNGKSGLGHMNLVIQVANLGNFHLVWQSAGMTPSLYQLRYMKYSLAIQITETLRKL